MNIIRKYWSEIFFTILFLLVGWYVSNYFSESKAQQLREDLKIMTLKKDSLVTIEEGLYTKMIADTAKVRELKDKVKELELKIKEPEVIIQKEIVFDSLSTKVKSKKIDSVNFKFADYYPEKDNYFIKYTARINTLAKSVKGRFVIQPLSLSSVMGVNEKKEYRINTRLPSFATISNLDVIATPYKDKRKKDVFGFIFGAGYGKSFETESDFLTMQTGIRLNKTYLFLNAGTNQTVGATLMVEF